MLEKLLTGFVSKLLGDYTEGFGVDSIRLSLLSGKLELDNVSIKRTALASLDIPAAVRSGSIGKLRVEVPWAHLSTKPTIVTIEDVLILIEPTSFKRVPGFLRVQLTMSRRKMLKRLMNLCGVRKRESW